MPLVAHPVRSLWGSQPRCARCVCEWLHRKWDGALPWDDSYTVDMEELYTELTLEQIENKPRGPTSVKLDSYMQLFEEKTTVTQQGKQTEQYPERKSRRKQKGKKILAKGEPGMGKSTFGRKIAYDWAKGVFTAVSVVFFVSMKLIRPGQTIENIIIEQTPVIEGLGVDKSKLRSILEGLGSKSLIIFDGLDEYDLGRNEDVAKIVKGGKLLPCNILLTSRPHAVEKVMRYFPVQVRIEGFSKRYAEHFVSKHLLNSEKTLDLLNFHKNNFAFVLVHSSSFCPLLLLFVCILVDNDELGPADKFIPLGEIYMKLVRFIYRKYCAQKGQTYDKKEFVSVLKRISKIAWRMLRSGQGWANQDDIIKEVGDHAFQLGLLIGHKGFNLSRQETADIHLTFGHVTVQEFMGSLGFLQLLDEGESIESLIAEDRGEQIIMQSRFFLRFCLWLLSDSCRNEYFEFNNRDKVYNSLLGYVANTVNIVQLDSEEIAEMFDILRVPFTDTGENLLFFKFIQGVLSRCHKTQEFYFSFTSYYHIDRLSDLLQCFPPHIQHASSPQKSLTLLESSTNHRALNGISDTCSKLGYHPDLLLESGILTDLSDCLRGSMRKLLLFDTYKFASRVMTEKQILLCPLLTNLTLDISQIDESVLTALNSAVNNGNLPVLAHLCFGGCGSSLMGKLWKLFHSQWPTLTNLNLDQCQLNQNDIETLTNCLIPGVNRKLPQLEGLVLFVNSTRKRKIPAETLRKFFQKALSSIKILELQRLSKEEYGSIAAAVNLGNLPTLRDLSISMTQRYDQNLDSKVTPCQVHRYATKRLSSINYATITDLTLHGFVCSPSHLTTVAMGTNRSMLAKLDISHSLGVTGALSKLLCRSFPSLRILVMSNCGLSSNDLHSLSHARKESRLQELVHLDVSQNAKCVGHLQNLFSSDQKWETLQILNVSQHVESDEDFQSLVPFLQSGALEKLATLTLSTNKSVAYTPSCMRVKWAKLQHLHIHCACRHGSSDHVKVFDQITQAVETGLLPCLQTLRVISVFISKRYDPMEILESFKNFLKSSSSRYHLDELAKTSSSLVTTALPRPDDNSYQLYLLGLKLFRVMEKDAAAQEYSIWDHFISKIKLIWSFSGDLPDLKTLCGVMRESVDNSPHFSEIQRLYLKSLGDAVCSSWHSWYFGQPLDLLQVCQALADCTENCIELSPVDIIFLKSMIEIVPSLIQRQKERFELAFRYIDAWIDRTPSLNLRERTELRLVLKDVYPAVRLTFEGQPLNLQALRRMLHSWIKNDPTIAEASRVHYKYAVDVVCMSLEAIVNRQPVDLQPVIHVMYEWIESAPSIQQQHRYSLERAAEFVFVLMQCWFNSPFDLRPLHDLMHGWIDSNPFHLSESDRFDFRSYADETYRQIHTLISRRASILDVLPSSSEPNERSMSVRAHYLIDGLGKDPSLCELRVLMHGMRKRGIRIYMHHIAQEEQ